MSNIKNNYPILVAAVLLVLIILPFYQDGRIISGGEGSYFIDFFTHLKNFGHTWYNAGTGIFTFSLNFSFVPHLLLAQLITGDEQVVNFIMIYCIFFLPLLAVYAIGREYRLKPLLAMIISVFYVTNVFSVNFFKYINQWNLLAAYFLPSSFLIIFHFFGKKYSLFFWFGINSLLFAFTNANPPLMAIYQISFPLLVLVSQLSHRKKFIFSLWIKNYLTVIISFVLFNLWWLGNWIYIYADATKAYSKEYAISWLRGDYHFVPELWRVLNLKQLLPNTALSQYDVLTVYYEQPIMGIITLIPFLVIVLYFLKTKKPPLVSISLLATILISAFFAKGTHGFGGKFYEFLVMNMPFFSIFKSAGEKWGVLLILTITLLFITVFRYSRSDWFKKLTLLLLLFYLYFSVQPFVKGQFIPDYKFNDEITGSRLFTDKSEYRQLRQQLNQDPLLYRVLALPGSVNYQVALTLGNGKYYTGNDPILNNTNKAFIAPYNGSFINRYSVLFESISSPNYFDVLKLFNVKKVIINKDYYPWFGYQEKETVFELETIFGQRFSGQSNDVFDIFDLEKSYLPRIYSPDRLIESLNTDQNDLVDLADLGSLEGRPIALLQSKEKETLDLEKSYARMASQNLLVAKVQSAVDEAKLRMGVTGYNPAGVLFPYARWKPGTILYPYVQKKETKTKTVYQNDPEAMLEQHLFFAAKRIYELQRWENTLTDYWYNSVINQYQSEMNQAIDILELFNEKGVDSFWYLAKIEVAFEAQSKRLHDLLKGNHPSDGENIPRLKFAQEVLDKIDFRLKKLIKEKYSLTKYQFDLEQAGDWEFLVSCDKISPLWKIKTLSESQTQLTLQTTQTRCDRGWWSYGSVALPAEKHLFYFEHPPFENIITGTWQQTTQPFILGKTRVPSKEEYQLLYQDLLLKPESSYRFSIRFKGGGKSKVRFLFVEGKDEVFQIDYADQDSTEPKFAVLLNSNIETRSEWDSFAAVFHTNPGQIPVRLIMSLEETGAPIEIDQLSLEEVVEPKIVLRQLHQDKNLFSPQISFSQLNPGKYLLDVKNVDRPYFLVLNDSYHRGWQVYQSRRPLDISKENVLQTYFDGQVSEIKHSRNLIDPQFWETWLHPSIARENHLVANIYANAWYIKPEDVGNLRDYQLIVEYWPQKLFYIGVFISLATGLISFMQIIRKKNKND